MSKDIKVGYIKCNSCGCEFKLSVKQHYVARDNEAVGIASLSTKEEIPIYDAFDCPNCGCQNIMNERKRKLMISININENEEDDLLLKEEYRSCANCKWDEESEYGYHCKDCKRNDGDDENWELKM